MKSSFATKPQYSSIWGPHWVWQPHNRQMASNLEMCQYSMNLYMYIRTYTVRPWVVQNGTLHCDLEQIDFLSDRINIRDYMLSISHICKCVCVYACVCVYLNVFLYVSMYACMCVCAKVFCLFGCLDVCVYVLHPSSSRWNHEELLSPHPRIQAPTHTCVWIYVQLHTYTCKLNNGETNIAAWHIAVCCGVLRCVAVCCSVLQCVAVRCK